MLRRYVVPGSFLLEPLCIRLTWVRSVSRNMILNCHGVVGLNPTVFGSTPKQLSRLVPVLPRGGGVKFNTRPIYCMHQAEDLNDKERVQCSKNGQ